jgi:hypothetical protein
MVALHSYSSQFGCIHLEEKGGEPKKIFPKIWVLPSLPFYSHVNPQSPLQTSPAQQPDPTLQYLELCLSQLPLFFHAPVPQDGLGKKEKGDLAPVTSPLASPLR